MATTLIDGKGLRRVVITGIGVVSPLGIGTEQVWQAAKAGTSTAAPIRQFDPSDCATHFACEVPDDFDIEQFLDRKTARRMDRFSHLGVAAAMLGFEDSGIKGTVTPDRMGVIIGSGIGGIQTWHDQTVRLRDMGPTRVSPLFIPTIIANMGAAQSSMELGLQGPLSCSTTACASANHAIGDAFDHIRLGRADAMIAGGREAALTALAVRDGIVPPTINVTDLDPECAGVDHVLGEAREADVRVALSNVFGFGGHNATLAFRRMEG